jgi:hypothetical protein
MRRETGNHVPDEHVCRVSYWQGYVSGCFYAYDSNRSRALLLSPPFRTWTWRHGNVARHDGDAAREAYDSLVRELRARGWRPVGADVAIEVPQSINPDTVLNALRRIGGDTGD